MNDYFIIPARKNSKGFKFKNRSLFFKTAESLKSISEKVIISSDDEQIESLNSFGFNFHKRSAHLSSDKISIRPVLEDVASTYKLKPNDNLILCYLTYPERTLNDILEILKFYKNQNAKSLLCREPLEQHPYLCFYERGLKGERIVNHNLYRRQDYPKCFFGSHFLAILKVDYLKKVDFNLFCNETIFFDLNSNKIDVDYENDFNKIK